METVDKIKYLSTQSKNYEGLYDIIWKMNKISEYKREFSKLKLGLFNIPCNGFGDIILCNTFYRLLKTWYPLMNITVCSTNPDKFKKLGCCHKITTIHSKHDYKECLNFDELIFKAKIKFDMMIVVPLIDKPFHIKTFQKLIPYANIFNTFSMSEYNGEDPPYTFPIGVGEGQLGLLLNDNKIKQHNLIKGPYALVYIQPSPQWGIHASYCFFSYLEMICKNYKKYSKFQIIIPEWIKEDIEGNSNFKTKLRKIIKPYFKNCKLIYDKNDEEYILTNDKSKTLLILRGDILPQPRNIFISLIKDSIKDVLLTGDQSITDAISCCQQKRIWYQIAPWKEGFAYHLYKELPNKYFKSFHSSCGTLKSINLDIEWKKFKKKYDFKIHGKERMDLLLTGFNILKKDEKLMKKLVTIIEHSRYLETAQKKIMDL
jgi:hypothetical protein